MCHENVWPLYQCSRQPKLSKAALTRTSRMNYLSSPPLVIAYALAGTMDFDFENEPLGNDPDGTPVYLQDIWARSGRSSGYDRSVD